MPELLVEVGAEELPPHALPAVLEQLAREAQAALQEARLEVREVQTTGTVRRLVLTAVLAAARQRDVVTVVRGPAARVAFDAQGRPTQAAVGFARAQGVPVEALQVRDLDGGRYVVAERHAPGRPAAVVLAEVLPGVLGRLVFPKMMRWNGDGVRFGRPIRWIVALLDRQVVPLSFAGVRAGRRTVGHRVLAPRAITLPQAAAYPAAMRQGRVILDPAARRARIARGATRLAAAVGGRPLLDAALLDELVWSIEHPTPLLGRFEERFARDLPRPVVLVTLQHHQKCFGVEGADGALLPAFIAVRDGGMAHLAAVRTGHEWVVHARLADARFFLEEDRRGTFDAWDAALARVAHGAGLGSMADHVERLARVAQWLAGAVGASADDRATVARAARLCKADLVTAMVGEFPELQGVVGRLYAEERGEPAAVAQAIEEHYWPKGPGEPLPATLPGALLAIADRAVLLAGAFLRGLEPTGSQDPYGLRRAASGIAVIAAERGLPLGLRSLFDEAMAAYAAPVDDRARAVEACVAFTLQRLRTWLEEQGIAYDTLDAVLAVGDDRPADLAARARALQAARRQPAMPRLATAFARASRILSQGTAADRVAPDLFVEPEEAELYRAWQEVAAIVEAEAAAGRYPAALEALVRLADPVDAFFDRVLVMAPDERLRGNRLALLRAVTQSFLRVADFGRLAG
ncbi:MAG: glycine--tRNA ligase subunit beta [Armatimonadota bacterium]|nr:glycine--tRNA ligase subunit beta [Armatimonadota bacterium]